MSNKSIIALTACLLSCRQPKQPPEPTDTMSEAAEETSAAADDHDQLEELEPVTDLPNFARCCDCETRECTPAESVHDCPAGSEWCYVDQDGEPSRCWILCSPIGSCCDCQAVRCRLANRSGCTGHWERWCKIGDEYGCYEQCIVE